MPRKGSKSRLLAYSQDYLETPTIPFGDQNIVIFAREKMKAWDKPCSNLAQSRTVQHELAPNDVVNKSCNNLRGGVFLAGVPSPGEGPAYICKARICTMHHDN